MRIFCFGSDFPPTGGGISTHTHEWLKALAEEKDIKVRATIFGNKEPRQTKVGIIEVSVLRPSGFFFVGWRILKDMWKYRHYEVFHSFNLFPVGFWTVFWSKILERKSVLTIYGADVADKRTSSKVVWLQGWAIRNATNVVTISEFSKSKIIERYGDYGNIHVIHPILPVQEKVYEDVRQKWRIAKDDFVILSVSRLVKRKGVEFLIDAVKKINNPSVKLLVVGDGPEKDWLMKMKNDQIIFTGKVPALSPYYEACNVVALVSYIIPEEGDFEGLGLVLIEAQSHGKPVIGSKSGGIPETFEDDKTGILVPEKNAQVIADAILRIKNFKMQNPHEFLEREFGHKATVGKYLNLIQ